MLATLHRKSERTVEQGQLVRPKSFRLALPEPHSRHTQCPFDFVVQGHRVTEDVHSARQGLELLAGLLGHKLGRFENNPGMQEALPTPDPLQLLPDSDPDPLR